MTLPATGQADLADYPLQRECIYRPAAGTAGFRQPGPITKVRLYDGKTAWLVTGPEQARALLADRRCSNRTDFPNYPVIDERHKHMRATREMAQEEEGGFAGALFGVDPPEHTSQRQILVPSFTLRKIGAHRPAIQQIVDDLLDDMQRQGPPADLLTAFAAPVPMRVICLFLGVPYAEREEFEAPARDLFHPGRADAAMTELTGYLDRLITAKQASPGTGVLDDLVTAQLAPGHLSRAELIAFALAILVAGTVTSTSMIALGVLALLDNPGQYAALAADHDLVPGAIEELLRYVCPVEQLARVATADIEVGGQVIRAGDGILVSFAASNLDPAVTSHPARLDVTSPPNHHLAFSFGIHHCLGRNLARLELDVALRSLVTRFPSLSPAVPAGDIPGYHDGTVPRLLSFPVTW